MDDDSRSERDRARQVFLAMLKARQLETKLSSLYKAGKIVGGVYVGKGQEAVSGSLGAALIPGCDVYAPLIRDQAGRTAFGEDLLDCARTYLGSVKGPMRGRDGNVHRGRPKEGALVMISHLGTTVSLVCGVLMARRLKGQIEGMVGATSIGEGGTSTGSFHEGLNLAAVEKLPLVMVVVNNQFAYSTPTDRQFACADLLDRAKGYGVDGHHVNGTDFLECVNVLDQAVARARAGNGPQLVVAQLLRLSGHGEHDDASYVPDSLRDGPLGRDCLVVGERQLVEKGFASEEEIRQWRVEVSDAVQRVLAKAQQEPQPDPWHEEWDARSADVMI